MKKIILLVCLSVSQTVFAGDILHCANTKGPHLYSELRIYEEEGSYAYEALECEVDETGLCTKALYEGHGPFERLFYGDRPLMSFKNDHASLKHVRLCGNENVYNFSDGTGNNLYFENEECVTNK